MGAEKGNNGRAFISESEFSEEMMDIHKRLLSPFRERYRCFTKTIVGIKYRKH